ncbi:Chitin synthase, class 1 [Dinochytrium kinnereticum]|nr:Chitin synthase, class 1 [Dinochytrium kinnereticum]
MNNGNGGEHSPHQHQQHHRVRIMEREPSEISVGGDGPPLNPNTAAAADYDDENIFDDGASIISSHVQEGEARPPNILFSRPTIRTQVPHYQASRPAENAYGGAGPSVAFNTAGLTSPSSPLESPVNRSYTQMRTLTRRQKTVKLGPSGNLVIKSKVADELLAMCPLTDSEEFTTVRYTAVTCDPDDFQMKGFTLRAANYSREVEMFVVVTMYNEDYKGFTRTMFGLAENLKYLCKQRKWGWDQEAWRKVVICIVSDGRSKINPEVLKCLEVMGVYQDGLAQSSINNVPVEAHVYEFTTQISLDSKLNVWTAKNGIVPMQIIFCLKERNAKKINSHRWFFKGFAPLLNPRVCVLIDVGTKPSSNALYALWEAFFRNDQIAGACGEIRVDLGGGKKYLKNILNPLVASQNFEYKISNLLDKSLESVFGYISVLPGAFSAYRYEALLDIEPNNGPLAKYFEGEQGKQGGSDSSIFSANLYLAEDRILCFELVAKRHARWTLHYVSKAYAETDVPDTVPEFLSQRRRWLNGSLFAGFYALSNIGRMWQSNHRIWRKLGFTFQYVYNIVNQVFSWFILGNFAATFQFLFNDLKNLLTDPYDPSKPRDMGAKVISIIINIAQFSYPVVLICLFIISFGNRPQAFRMTYTAVMAVLGLIGIVMIGLLISRIFTLFTTNTNGLLSGYMDVLNPNAVKALETRTEDPMIFMLDSLVVTVSDVLYTNLEKNLLMGFKLKAAYVITLCATFGVMFAASFIQLDFAHMFTSFIQYLILLPSYINVLTVYALSNLHDVSWGTKGDNVAEVLPSVAVQQKDGSLVANLNVVSDRADRSAHYQAVQAELLEIASKSKQKEPSVVKLSQEDSYRGFRTKLILSYLASNAALYFVATTLGQTDVYLIIVLGGVACLQAVKFIGVLLFLFAKFCTDVLMINHAGKRNMRLMKKDGFSGGGEEGPVTTGKYGSKEEDGYAMIDKSRFSTVSALVT